MYPDPSLTLADQMVRIVDVFLKTLTPEVGRRRLGGWLWGAIRNRVGRLSRRFCALYAMWKAGTLPEVRVSAAAPPPPEPPRSSPGAMPHSPVKGEGEGRVALAADVAMWKCPASLMPRALRWMQGMLPSSAATLAAGMDSLARNYPEMQDFVRECPQAGRVLRPLLRMAGLTAPEYLRLPKRGRDRAPAPPPPPPPGSSPGAVPHSPVKGEGGKRKRRTAREVAADAIERSNRTGKPIDPRKIGAVAFGYVLHWPRDGNCPPPEIGYGGRTFPPLPKDYEWPKE